MIPSYAFPRFWQLWLWALLSGVLLSGCTGLFKGRQTMLRDTLAESLVAQGQRALQADNNDGAADAFERALQRPFNRLTTLATYLSGYTYYKLTWNELAQQRFELLIRTYPKSRYVPDARYHLALMGLDARQELVKVQAVLSLLKIAADYSGQAIGADAETAAREALFTRGGPDLPAACFRALPRNQQHLAMEAWAYRDVLAGKRADALTNYQTFRKEGGAETPFLKALFPEGVKPGIPAGPLKGPVRMAVLLPFHLDEMSLGESGESGALGMEFYQGFRLAMEEYAFTARQPIFVRAIDTRRDTALLFQTQRALDSLRPMVVVGGIFNGLSRNLSQWAEARGVAQVVPISATQELVLGKSHTFLAHPSTSDHGARMARYARETARLRNVVVFSDGSSATEQLAAAFMDEFISKGGKATLVRFAFSERVNLNPIRSALVAGVDGVYLPYLNNEETANLVLTQLVDKNLVVMGSPHFKTRYLTIDRQLKERLNIVFSTSHHVEGNDPVWLAFERRYLERYATQPSEFAIQGYDLGGFLSRQLENWAAQPGIPFAAYLRNAPPRKGIHISYDFRGAQSNQYVNLSRFTPTGIVRIE